MNKVWRIATTTALILIAAAVILRLGSPERENVPALPTPNGYQDFREAGRIARGPVASVSEMAVTDLATLVARETKALDLVKSGLEKECAVPLEFSETWLRAHLTQDLAPAKTLSSIINAEARLIATTNAGAGAKAYVDSLRFADAVGRGGLIIDHLVGLACQHFPAKRLKEMRDQLEVAEAREVFDGLETVYRNRQVGKEVLERELQWARIAGNWRSRAAVFIRPGLLKPAHDNYMERAKAGEDELKALLIDYGARISELDKEKKHEDLKWIVDEL